MSQTGKIINCRVVLKTKSIISMYPLQSAHRLDCIYCIFSVAGHLFISTAESNSTISEPGLHQRQAFLSKSFCLTRVSGHDHVTKACFDLLPFAPLQLLPYADYTIASDDSLIRQLNKITRIRPQNCFNFHTSKNILYSGLHMF